MKPLHLGRAKTEDEMDEGMDINESSRLPTHSTSNRFANFFRFTNPTTERQPIVPRERRSEGDINTMNSDSNNYESTDVEKDKMKEEITKLEAEIQSLRQTIARKEEQLANLKKEVGITPSYSFTQIKEKFQTTFSLKKPSSPDSMPSNQEDNTSLKDRFKEGSENTMKAIEEKFQSAGSALKRSILRRSLRGVTGT